MEQQENPKISGTLTQILSRVALRTLKAFGIGLAGGFIIVTFPFVLLAPDRIKLGIPSVVLWIWGVKIGLVYGATTGGLLGVAAGLVYALIVEVDSQT